MDWKQCEWIGIDLIFIEERERKRGREKREGKKEENTVKSK